MTVDGGTKLDSRQYFKEDPWSWASHRALTGSVLWWRVVLSLVNPVVAEVGEDAFSYVIGTQSVKDVRSDGSLRKRRLKSLLRGDVTKIEFFRPLGRPSIPKGFKPIGNVAYRVDTSGKQWVFAEIDQPPYIAAHAAGASAIIDTNSWPWMLRGQDDDFKIFEEARVFDDVVLVLPHTFGVEAFLRDYVKWIRGRRSENTKGNLASPSIEWRHNNFEMIPEDDHFGVTGIIQNGRWRDPSDLEAARVLLQSRYDFKFGLWDLANNPVLRQTLLASIPTERTSQMSAELPARAKERAIERAARMSRGENGRKASPSAIYDLFRHHGWLGRRYDFRNCARVYLTLDITESQTAISVFSWGRPSIGPFLKQHVDEFESIASPNECDVHNGNFVLWLAPGGWAGDIDWEDRVSTILKCTTRWEKIMRTLPSK
jgi:hypothetical protein